MSFKEIRVGKELALRFYPSDNGWMCGITPEMMEALEQAEKQAALERMADNTRELGLDYTPMQAEKQEPVAWMNDSTPAGVFARHKQGAENFGCTIPLYTAPPQRQPLTEEEIKTVRHLIDWTAGWSYIDFARAIERKHGIGGDK